MIEFGTKRSGGGKKSRLHKKFPRKKIDKVGEKVAGWFRSNWDDDSYPYFSGNLRKFLLSNVGRPVDKVFSEFLGRCRTSAKRYNLRHEFYSMFEEKRILAIGEDSILLMVLSTIRRKESLLAENLLCLYQTSIESLSLRISRRYAKDVRKHTRSSI